MNVLCFKSINKTIIFALIVCLLCGCVSKKSDVENNYDEPSANENGNDSFKIGKVIYKSDNNRYEFVGNNIDQTAPPLGKFSVVGDDDLAFDLESSNYNLNSDKISLVYSWNIGDDENENEWYVGTSNTRKIDLYDIGTKMGKGVIMVQSSKDGENWATNEVKANFIEDLKNGKTYSYETNEIQLNYGCYYRLIVAYKLEKFQNEQYAKFLTKKNKEEKAYAEVYTLFATNSNTSANTIKDNEKKFKLSDKALWCKQFDGYADTKEISVDDELHYGWNLGSFLVSGHADIVRDNVNTPVVLKNLGDEVVLWFRLEQNINALNGDDSMRITSDLSGKDQYFETSTQDFGRGTLIVSKKNYQNENNEVEIYTNFLESYITPGTDTMVSLFEEGDYEVTLDYEVTKDTLKVFDKKVLDKVRHYKINFKFSVRNSNCMVYPLDAITGEKLINGSYTKNGFYLDLAKSRYLSLNIKRSNLIDGDYELVEDTTFNQIAKEGDLYTEEGLYTISVSNRYTGANEIKKIYVGENDILKAYVVTGLSISEIKKKLEMGAIINEDGTIGEYEPIETDLVFAGLDDDDLLNYVEDCVYLDLTRKIDDEDLYIDEVKAEFISKDYLENLTYNSKNNVYFGYDTSQLNGLMDGNKYIFTIGEDYSTVIKQVVKIDDSITGEVINNVLVGSGVILVCVTISSVTVSTLPAVSVIFAASATTGTTFAINSGCFSAISGAIIRGYQTGDMKEALEAALLKGSEGFKWGAISGAISGGAKETLALYNATKGGLTLNQVAKIQKETNYPLDLIAQIQNEEQVKILQESGLVPELIDGKMALIRDIDLDFVDELGRTNRERILLDLSPLDPDGLPYELHHVAQNPDGTLAILTQAEHRSKETYSIWHLSQENGVHAELSTNEWAKIRNNFWKSYLELKG